MSAITPADMCENCKQPNCYCECHKPGPSELAPARGSPAKPLFVDARIYNEDGSYRVLSIGGTGHNQSNMDCAKILRKLANWIENEWRENSEVTDRRGK